MCRSNSVAVRCSVLQCAAVRCSLLQCCRVLQCVATRCSALQTPATARQRDQRETVPKLLAAMTLALELRAIDSEVMSFRVPALIFSVLGGGGFHGGKKYKKRIIIH